MCHYIWFFGSGHETLGFMCVRQVFYQRSYSSDPTQILLRVTVPEVWGRVESVLLHRDD